MKRHYPQTKKIVLSLLAAFTIGATFAQSKPVKIIQNADTLIKANQTWDADTIYFLRGKVYVTNSAELTIQPGTVISGDTISKGALLITKGSKIHALGTPSCPIVFTSSKSPGRRNRGDWGGLILLGKASVNTPTGVANIEGLPPSTLTEYGGGANPDDNDNSGELNFVRVEFAGVALSPNNEINGLTFGGVGRGTLVDYVQVSYSNDDSYEWFGGTVNCKHLIAFRGIDDDFDTDNGYSGKLQFGIGVRDPLIADISGSKAFESDNDASGSTNLPQTKATFCNFSCVAGSDSATNPNFRDGVHIRRNSHMNLYNSIVMGFPDGINIDGTAAQNNVLADTMLEHNIVAVTYAPKYVVTTSPSANSLVIDLLQNHADNRFYPGNTQVKLRNPYFLNKPDMRPLTGSPALNSADFNETALNDPFFQQVSYVGAMGKLITDNWAQIWVNFKPTSTNYALVDSSCATSAAFTAATKENITTEKKEIKIYPNPSTGTFTISTKEFSKSNVTVKISDLNTGRIVYNNLTKNNGVITLNLNIPAGLYLVELNDGFTAATQKMNIIK